jgi:predicted AlkP superfamily pyrophosphatase or phosphodiesterase
VVALGLFTTVGAQAASVLMISVDGMRPDYVLEADAHGLKIPFLRKLSTDGAYAQGVDGVWPTNTYPSHTTLLTGVLPADHGITTNLEFDPNHTFAAAWFWYARQIRVPTLWQAARRAGLKTASVGWPVSVGAEDVDVLIPEYWRLTQPTPLLNPSDRDLIAALSRPAGLLDRMQASLGPYLMGNDTSLEGDRIKTRFALDILRRERPQFMTLHLSSLDEVEHEHGPFSPEANQDLEALDEQISQLVAASRANDPRAVAVVVSDHGFAPMTRVVNLYLPFLEAGLIDTSLDPQTGTPTVKSWSAQPWLASGMAAIMLHDPTDAAVKDKVLNLLHSLAQNPDCGIAEILDDAAIARRGAFPGASFLVVMKPGYYTGAAMRGALTSDFSGHGGHGFAPTFPEMRSAFIAAGAGIAANRDLGVIDMRRIAPTVAALLGVSLPSARSPALNLRR